MEANGSQSPGRGDLTGGGASPEWLVCGWFTPDYRPRAERLAAGLVAHGAPYHLRELEKGVGAWTHQVKRKPSIILEAMRAHPQSTVVFMDVDCEIRGDVAPATRFGADAACFLYVKKRAGRQLGDMSSRVMVLRPTPGAQKLVEVWIAACAEDPAATSDEPSLLVAIARAAGCSWTPLDPRYAGREVTNALPDAAIVHDSAREQSSGFRRFKRQAKTLRRQVFGSFTRGLVGK